MACAIWLSEATCAHHLTKAANPRLRSQDCELLPAETNYQSTDTLLRNVAIDGYHSLVNGVISLLVFVMSWVPRLPLWGVPLLILLRFVSRRWRRKAAM